jgi:hypothetical protein
LDGEKGIFENCYCGGPHGRTKYPDAQNTQSYESALAQMAMEILFGLDDTFGSAGNTKKPKKIAMDNWTRAPKERTGEAKSS